VFANEASHASVCSNLPPFSLKQTTRGADILHVVFQKCGESNTDIFSRLNEHVKSERTRLHQLPVHGVLLLLENEPNVNFTLKLNALHTNKIEPHLRCEYELWTLPSMWINPYNVSCVSRHKLMPDFNEKTRSLLQRENGVALANQHVHTYRRLLDTDIICRFLGFQRGNMVAVWNEWNQSEINAVPHIVVSEHDA
jgi:hypothetical protein